MALINQQDAAELVTRYCQEYYNLNPVAVIEKLMEMPAQPEEYTIEMQEADIDEAMKRLRDARVTILPSAQPDIIACGDCKHWICHDRRCGYWNHGVKPLDWCCHGERKTDE